MPADARRTHRFSRGDLYELVWSEPMVKLAKRLGVSGRGLAKVCARINVPVPGRGNWAKLQHGKKVRRQPLPSRPDGAPGLAEITPAIPRPEPPKLPPGVQEQIARETTPERKIVVPKGLANAHRVVRAWLEHERGRARALPGWPTGLAPSPRRVTDVERRWLRILSALFKALEKRGHQIVADPESIYEVWAVVAGEKVEFALTRRQRKVKVELGPTEKKEPRNILEGRTQRVEQRVTDELVFRIRSVWPGPGVRTEWAEAPGRPLEDQLNGVVAGLVVASAVVRERRLKWAEEERRHRDQAARRLEREEAERAETLRFQQLLAQVQRWRQANDIRAYVDAVRANALATLPQEGAGGIEGWALWVLDHADRIDPLTSRGLHGEDPDLSMENGSTHGLHPRVRNADRIGSQ